MKTPLVGNMSISPIRAKKHSKSKKSKPKTSHKRPTIGFLTSGVAEPLRLVMWTAIAEAAQENNVNIICIAGSELDKVSENQSLANHIFKLGNDEIIDALVMWGASISNYVPQEIYIKFCQQFKSKPMINIGHEVAGIPTVTTDDYIGMRNMVLHLVEDHGLRRIAFIRGPEAQIGAEERFRAYRDVLEEAGIQLNPNLISPPGAWDGYTGGNAIRIFIEERKENFEAVVGSNDLISLDAIWTLKNYGLNVPNDVVVVGFDDQIPAKAATPPLTTVHQPFRGQCKKAIDMALQILQGKKVPERVVIPTTLFIRESCGCASPAVERATSMYSFKTADADESVSEKNQTLSELVQISNIAIEGSDKEAIVKFFENFITEIENESTGDFLQTLSRLIESTIKEDGEIGIWQNAISSLRRYALNQYCDDAILVRVEDLSGQARVLISEKLQRAELYQKMLRERQYVEFREITKALYTTFDLDELVDALYRGLPRLGIRSCYISLFDRTSDPKDGEPQVNLDQSRLVLAFDARARLLKKQHLPYPSRDLLSQVEIGTRKNRYSFVFESLYRGKNPLGVILFEVEPPEGRVCDILQEQISSAIEASKRLPRENRLKSP
jgi:DNA-binding LacI/PurR family transcriptional regulator